MAPLKPAVAEMRRVRGALVYFAEDGRAFQIKPMRRVDGQVVERRVYGELAPCETCQQEYFKLPQARRRFCSIACSKKGNRNPSRKRTQKAIVTSCDKFFSLIVRSVGRCANCSSSTALQCAHGFSRRYRNVRWDERNAFCLCARCHVFFTHRPLEWDHWLLDRWGEEQYWAIRRLALSGEKPDMAQVYERLREKRDAL